AGAGRRLGMDYPDGSGIPGAACAVPGGAGHADGGYRLARRTVRYHAIPVTHRHSCSHRRRRPVLAADAAAAAPLPRRYRALGHGAAPVIDGAAGAAARLGRTAAAEVPGWPGD